jgi:hypothetical protein
MTSRTRHHFVALPVSLVAWMSIACGGADVGGDGGDESSDEGGSIFIDAGSSSEGGDEGIYDEDPAAVCDLTPFSCPHAMQRPLMLVLDNSYSMRGPRVSEWDHDHNEATPEVTRWRSLHHSLTIVMPALVQEREVGATLFPSFAPEATEAPLCSVAAAPEIGLGEDWEAAAKARRIPLSHDEVPGGAAPAAAGVEAGLAALAAHGGEVPGAIVLITDGPANCGGEADVQDPRLAAAVAEARARGILTYVIGMDIAEGVVSPEVDWLPDGVNAVDVRAALAELATLGGTAQPGATPFFDVHDEDALTLALWDVSAQASICMFEFDVALSEQYEFDGIRMSIDDKFVDYGEEPVADCAKESGWRFADDSRKRVELCGDACSLMQAGWAVGFRVWCPAGEW